MKVEPKQGSGTDKQSRRPSLRQRFLGGVAWIGVSRAVLSILQLGVTAILARLLVPSDYGLVGMVVVFTAFASQFQDLGVSASFVRLENISVNDERLAFTASLVTSILLYLALYFASDPIAHFYKEPRVALIMQVIGLTLPLSAFSVVPTAMLRRQLTMKGEAISSVVVVVFGSAITILLAWFGLGAWALVLGRLASSIIQAVALSVARPWRIGLSFHGKNLVYFYRFGSGISFGRLLWQVYSHADFLLIGKFLGPSSLGAYNMAWNLAKMPYERFWSAINPVVLPLFSRSIEEKRQLGPILIKLTRQMSLITFPAISGLALVADDAVTTLLGQKWIAVIIPLRWLCCYTLFRSLFVLLSPALVALGRIWPANIWSLICAVTFPLSFYYALRWEESGVAAIWAVIYPVAVIVWLLPYTLAATDISYRSYISALRSSFLATTIMCLAVVVFRWVFPFTGPARLAASILIGISAYVVGLYFLEEGVWSELRRSITDLRRGVL